MSSNIRVIRICQYCGKEFQAKTTVTKFCSHPCSRKAYKATLRQQKVEASDQEVQAIRTAPVKLAGGKEFLTVKDAAILLNSCRQTIYNLINAGHIKAVNIKIKKTLIARSQIDKLFELPEIRPAPPESVRKLKIEDCYHMGEIQAKFNISEKALYDLIKRNNIPKLQQGKFVYASKSIIDQLLNPFPRKS